MGKDLHAAIMNLGCMPDRNPAQEPSYCLGYKYGHRDMRHAAAELALAAPQQEAPGVREALTDERIAHLWAFAWSGDRVAFARAIEREVLAAAAPTGAVAEQDVYTGSEIYAAWLKVGADLAGLSWIDFSRHLAATPSPAPAAAPTRCRNCDDTGDVHGRDGEWRGVCWCPAGKALKAPQPSAPEQALQVLTAENEALGLYDQSASAKVQDATVYVLNARGANRWWASVQPGQDDDGKRISDDECRAIAQRLSWRGAQPSAPVEPVARIDSPPRRQADGLWRAEVTLAREVPHFTDFYTAPPPAEAVRVLTDNEWIDLAERHVNADWNSDKPDGYINAVQALCEDFAATSTGGTTL